MATLKSTGQVTITKILNAVSAVLTNNPVSVYAQSNGTVTDYTKTSTGIYIYEGPNQLTYDATGITKGTWRINSISATGITPGSVSDGGGYALTANHSAMTADNAQIVYTLVGLNSAGEAFSLNITQNLSKTKTGANGQTTYTWIVYADTAAGDGISRTSTNKRYIGIAVNKTTAAPSDNDLLNPGQFSWSPLYENVEVGGKNLIYYSDTLINSTTQKVAQYDLVEEWIPGREYTISLYLNTKNLNIGIMRDESLSYTAKIPSLIYDTVKDRYTLTFTAPEPIPGDVTRRKLSIFNLSFATNPNVSISRIQLEKGNVVTDWTPAVEDLQSKIINPNILKGSGDYSAFKTDLWIYNTSKAEKTLAQGFVSFKALNTTTSTYIELPIDEPTISNEAYTLSGKIEASTARTITIVGRDASNNTVTLLSLPIQTANQRQLFSISFKTVYNLTKIGFTAGSIPVVGNTLTIEWLKLEKGVFATPWVAHVNDGVLWQNYTTIALNGKNHIFWQTTQPMYGMIEGDIWYNTATLNNGVGGGIYRYTSGTWQEYELGSNAIAELAIKNAHIAELDAAKIMAHTITAEKIKAGTITSTEIKAESLTANDIKAGTLADVAGKNSINLTSGDFSLGNSAVTYNAGTGALNIVANSVKIGATSVATTTYADGKASTAENNAKTYADTKATDTLNAAKSDATTKANSAELNAKTYADTQLSEFSSTVLEDMESLQSQIDGSITTWFYQVPPTTSNAPANTWTTTELKNNHLGDLYYDTITGYAYRWQVVSNTYSWSRITDTDVTKALSDASKAQDTADSKRRVFTTTPTTPYEIGDLWAQGTAGELMRCKTAMLTGSFSATHWEKASKYTDDARAILAESNAKTYAETKATEAQTAAKTYTDTEISIVNGVIANKVSTTTYNAGIGSKEDTIYKQSTAPAHAAGRLWLDTTTTPNVLKRSTGSAWVKVTPTTAAEVGAYSSSDGNTLAGRIATAESNITQQAGQIASKVEKSIYNTKIGLLESSISTVTQTANSVRLDFDNQVVGGRNFLLASGVPIRTADYLMNSYDLTEAIAAGTEVTLTLKGSLAATKTTFSAYNSGGSVTLSDLDSLGNGIYRKTFNWTVGTASNTFVSIYQKAVGQTGTSTIEWIKLEKGNTPTDWSQAPEELFTGTTRIDKDGVTVGVSNDTIESNLSNEGVRIYDNTNPDEPIAIFGSSGSLIPALETYSITGDVINTLPGSLTFNIGSGKDYASVSAALATLNVNKKLTKFLSNHTIEFNIYGTISDKIIVNNFIGGTMNFNFQSGSKLVGSFYFAYNTTRITISGPSSSNYATIQHSSGDYLIDSFTNSYIEVRFMNLDGKNYATARGMRFYNGSTAYVINCDFSRMEHAIMSNYGSQVFAVGNRGNVTGYGYNITSAALYARSTCPTGATGNVSSGSGHYFTTGTITAAPTQYMQSAPKVQTYTETFYPSSMLTYKHDTSTRSTYYGNTAAQGKYSGMPSAVDGVIKFGTDAYDFTDGATITKIELSVYRTNTSHGPGAGVQPLPDDFTATPAFNAIGRGAWSNWVVVPKAELTSTGASFKFYHPTLNSGYAIFSNAKLRITISKTV